MWGLSHIAIRGIKKNQNRIQRKSYIARTSWELMGGFVIRYCKAWSMTDQIECVAATDLLFLYV